MSKVYFISDLHLGHEAVIEFASQYRGHVTNVDDHHRWLIEQWNSVVTKHDMVYVLGDVCFDKDYLPLLKNFKGNKHLILGNHDKFSMNKYQLYFNKVHGFEKYKGTAWLSHAPIHSGSLRGKWNIHGHVHHNTVDDLRYLNVSVEAVSGKPISWDTLLQIMEERRCLMKQDQLKYPPPSQNKDQRESSIIGALTAVTTVISEDLDKED
jgi:calcineurin-like phosphoesterase family protein